MTSDRGPGAARKLDAFSSVAIWQLLSFFCLLCFVWANEVIDFSSRIFGMDPAPFNLYRVCILSAGIITAGIITVGHTYERQRSLVKKLLMTCLYCHRVKTEDGTWEHVEEYFMKHYPVTLNRGPCPDCEKMLHSVDAKELQEESARS